MKIILRKLLGWWGGFRFMWQHIAFYVSGLNLVMIAITTYNTTAREWALAYFGFELSFWVFIGAIALVILCAIAFEYKVTVPFLLGFSNEQVYKHGNLIRRDIDKVREKQKELDTKLDKIAKHLGVRWE